MSESGQFLIFYLGTWGTNSRPRACWDLLNAEIVIYKEEGGAQYIYFQNSEQNCKKSIKLSKKYLAENVLNNSIKYIQKFKYLRR